MRRTSSFLAVALLTAVTSTLSTAGAQEKRSDTLLTVEHYLDLEQVSDPKISPDGKQVIYTRRYVNKIEDRWDSALWIMNADGSRNRMLAKGAGAVWSPDGTRIAYLAEGEPRGAQIFVRWMDAEGATSQVTRTEESPADVRWSPDGKWLGFSMFVPTPRVWRIDLPDAPKGARWTAAPRYVASLHFKQDRRGLTDPGNRHLFVVPADGGAARQVTNGNWSVGSRFDALDGAVGWSWMPDGRSIVFDGLADTSSDMNYRNSYLYSVEIGTGAVRRLLMQNGAWASPVVSPDGRRIAYSGYTRVNDSYHASELYVMNADGSGAQKLTGDLDRDVGDITWAPDGGLYFTVADHGTSNVYYVNLSGGALRPVTIGEHMIGGFDAATRAGFAVGTRSSYKEPAEVVRIALRSESGRGQIARTGDVASLARVNDAMLSRITLGNVERVTYQSSGGARIDGWIVKPPGFVASKKYPLIMEIHGGPHGMYNVAFNYQFQNFAANGYVVLYTNPRGSTGYGSAFGNAIMHAYPSVDYEDLMAGVDTLVRRGYIDTTSMYVGGCSGGGVLSSWVIGHTNRFAAAAVRCPVINWMSFAGESDVPLFTYNFFDKPFWEAPEQWLKQSPLMYVGNVTTPTVVMTGELDRRTPMPQSEEYYAALKMRGVPAALLRFEGEFHGTSSKPSNFMRTQLYMMSWYKQWKRASSGSVTTAAR
jgi:dipeptidyl aminopeptidase/acylaminoacyl peptidase